MVDVFLATAFPKQPITDRQFAEIFGRMVITRLFSCQDEDEREIEIIRAEATRAFHYARRVLESR